MVGDKKLGGGIRLKDRKSMNYTTLGLGTARPQGVTVPQEVSGYPGQVSYLPIHSRDMRSAVRRVQFTLRSTQGSSPRHLDSWRLGERLRERYRSCPDNTYAARANRTLLPPTCQRAPEKPLTPCP